MINAMLGTINRMRTNGHYMKFIPVAQDTWVYWEGDTCKGFITTEDRDQIITEAWKALN